MTHERDSVKRMPSGPIEGQDDAEDRLRAFLESCPEDEEPTAEEDLAAIQAGKDELARGELVPQAEVLARNVSWAA